jgi:hypothetical protein
MFYVYHGGKKKCTIKKSEGVEGKVGKRYWEIPEGGLDLLQLQSVLDNAILRIICVVWWLNGRQVWRLQSGLRRS